MAAACLVFILFFPYSYFFCRLVMSGLLSAAAMVPVYKMNSSLCINFEGADFKVNDMDSRDQSLVWVKTEYLL